MSADRRRHERIALRVPLYVVIGGEIFQKMVELETANVSEGGLAFETHRDIPLESESLVMVSRLGGLLPARPRAGGLHGRHHLHELPGRHRHRSPVPDRRLEAGGGKPSRRGLMKRPANGNERRAEPDSLRRQGIETPSDRMPVISNRVSIPWKRAGGLGQGIRIARSCGRRPKLAWDQGRFGYLGGATQHPPAQLELSSNIRSSVRCSGLKLSSEIT